MFPLFTNIGDICFLTNGFLVRSTSIKKDNKNPKLIKLKKKVKLEE
jgi:hypothetical protein